MVIVHYPCLPTGRVEKISPSPMADRNDNRDELLTSFQFQVSSFTSSAMANHALAGLARGLIVR